MASSTICKLLTLSSMRSVFSYSANSCAAWVQVELPTIIRSDVPPFCFQQGMFLLPLYSCRYLGWQVAKYLSMLWRTIRIKHHTSEWSRQHLSQLLEWKIWISPPFQSRIVVDWLVMAMEIENICLNRLSIVFCYNKILNTRTILQLRASIFRSFSFKCIEGQKMIFLPLPGQIVLPSKYLV